MRRKLAHLLRRVARVLIRWSTKLEPPAVHNEHRTDTDLWHYLAALRGPRYQ